MKRCSSGKISYLSEILAEEALIDIWIRNNYKVGQGPVNIYRCDSCGNYHFTSKGDKSKMLQSKLDSGEIQRSQLAYQAESRLGKR